MAEFAVAQGRSRQDGDEAAKGNNMQPGQSGTRPSRPWESPRLEPIDGTGTLLYGHDTAVRGRDSLLRRLLAMSDALALVGAYALLWVFAPPPNAVTDDAALLLAIPVWIVLNKILGLYDRDANLIHRSTLNELPGVFHSISLGTALAFLFGPLLPGVEMHRTQVIVWWLTAIVLTPLLRSGARRIVRAATEPERIVIVGSGQVASLVATKIASHPEYGATLVGCIDADDENGAGVIDDLPRLGTVEDFEKLVEEHDIERVVIAFSSMDHEPLLHLIRTSKRLRLKISIVPRLFEVIGHGVELDQIEGMTLLGLRGLGRTKSTLALKRAVDVAGAGIGLLVLAPLLALVAIAVKLDSRGPIFFGQHRRGRGEGEFTMWKFRTMVVGADEMQAELSHLNEMVDGPMFKITEDPRVTRVGRWLRRSSIDELPQLWNVLRGDMSLVGPRPLVPAEDDHVMGWHRARLDLTPGLTGPWQVLGRNSIPFHEMVKLDYLYVAEWSLWNDFKLMLRTVPVITGRRGT